MKYEKILKQKKYQKGAGRKMRPAPFKSPKELTG